VTRYGYPGHFRNPSGEEIREDDGDYRRAGVGGDRGEGFGGAFVWIKEKNRVYNNSMNRDAVIRILKERNAELEKQYGGLIVSKGGDFPNSSDLNYLLISTSKPGRGKLQ
jgi:hypothetical protein